MIHLPHPSVLIATTFWPSRRAPRFPGAESQRAAEQPTSRRSPAPKGLTIIEVLVALAFLAVFAAGITGLAIAILNGNAKSQASDTAVYLALDKLESIRNKAYSTVAAGSATEAYGTITVATSSGTVAYTDFQRTTVVTNDTPKTGMKRVVVTVISRRGNNVSHEMIIGQ
jgi:prepilin-type N-terminal cleavage/methylation domain-containing protein